MPCCAIAELEALAVNYGKQESETGTERTTDTITTFVIRIASVRECANIRRCGQSENYS